MLSESGRRVATWTAIVCMALVAACGGSEPRAQTPAPDGGSTSSILPSPVPGRAVDYELGADAARQRGLYAAHDDTPESLVVLAHGCCYATNPTLRDFVGELVEQLVFTRDVAVVAPDFRGDGHWSVHAGIDDVLAAARAIRSSYPRATRTIVWGFSMGGQIAGVAAAQVPELFDYWVDTFGVSDLVAYLSEAERLGPAGREAILRDMGGRGPDASPAAYEAVSPRFHAKRLRALDRVYILHGRDDNVVPFAQSEAMFDALRGASVPVTFVAANSLPHGARGVNRTLDLVVGPLVSGEVPFAATPTQLCVDSGTPAPTCAPM